MARELVGEIFGVVRFQDWLHVSGVLMDAYRDATEDDAITDPRDLG